MTNVDEVRQVVEALRTAPDQFSDDDLGEVAAMGREITKLAAARFTERLLQRGNAPAQP